MSEKQTLAVSIPVSLESFPPYPLVLIPMRWVHRANRMRKGEGGLYIMRKLLRSNVGRKFRRYLRKHNAALAARGIPYGWGGRRLEVSK